MSNVRILESDSNRRGDLFGRLMADLFVALGYDEPRLNIHKSGREIDLTTGHRLEPRSALAECKATADPSGGSDLNKFVGALDAEDDGNTPTTGYFVSLSGFTATALEQERQRKRTKVICLDGRQVVDALITGRRIISREHATEVAGRHCANRDHLALDATPELCAHERGWIWIVYYSQGKQRTHFVLIFADGTPLANAVAQEIVSADAACEGSLHTLERLNKPAVVPPNDPVSLKAALDAYASYLADECGFIQLDGLPPDNDVGPRRLKLENLFVPLHLDLQEQKRAPVGSVLSRFRRLAILAPPGGGKSTLIKRIAIAYSDPARLDHEGDTLPSRDWLPLLFRCRDLRDLARASFGELVEALSKRDHVLAHASTFLSLIDSALTSGRALLLVDGLDEIDNPGDRAAFVSTMRTALQAYPGTSIVITSREAGFRHVAAHLASLCEHATLAPFNEADITRLTVAWHTEVLADTSKVRREAAALAAAIHRSDRIRRLASNPLLLTTLLLVKRWVGALPTKRAMLYREAVRVLLITWNTEGHDPIHEDEAMPQLCYVASAMMMDGVERISRPRLTALLNEARVALPTELGFVDESVDRFVHRVEDRSSLLMMSGRDVENGQLEEMFEFRHLTFQEFLAARAMVMGWRRGHRDDEPLMTALEPYVYDDRWREVIPLAASMGGRATEGVIGKLTDLVASSDRKESNATVAYALASCLADEAAVQPETVRAALRVLAAVGSRSLKPGYSGVVPALARSRYGTMFLEEVEVAFFGTDDFGFASRLMKQVLQSQSESHDDEAGRDGLIQRYCLMMNSSDNRERFRGAFGLLNLTASEERPNVPVEDELNQVFIDWLYSNDTRQNYVAGWWFYNRSFEEWSPPSQPDVLGRMWELCRRSESEVVRLHLAEALGAQSLQSRDEGRCATVSLDDIDAAWKEDLDGRTRGACLIVSWYRRYCDDETLIKTIPRYRELKGVRSAINDARLDDLLLMMGAPRSRG